MQNVLQSVGVSQKVRQSLDNIKKQHSLINMEKQYRDEIDQALADLAHFKS